MSRRTLARLDAIECALGVTVAPPLMILWSRDNLLVAVSVNGEDFTPEAIQAYLDTHAHLWTGKPYTYQVNMEPCI